MKMTCPNCHTTYISNNQIPPAAKTRRPTAQNVIAPSNITPGRDVGEWGALSLRIGGWAMLQMGLALLAIYWPTLWPIWLVIEAGLLGAGLFFAPYALKFFQDIQPELAPTPPAIAPKKIEVKATVVENKKTIYAYFDIQSTAAFHSMCHAYTYGKSRKVNFSGTEAKRHKVAGWLKIKAAWENAGLFEPGTTNGTKTTQLNAAGRALVKKFADTPTTV